jgi:hypothetical protein
LSWIGIDQIGIPILSGLEKYSDLSSEKLKLKINKNTRCDWRLEK